MEPIRRLFQRIITATTPGGTPPERPLHVIERRLAKEYVKRRLAVLYPELRSDPEALERAYRALNIEPKGVVQRPEGELKSFGLRVEDGLERPFEQR